MSDWPPCTRGCARVVCGVCSRSVCIHLKVDACTLSVWCAVCLCVSVWCAVCACVVCGVHTGVVCACVSVCVRVSVSVCVSV